MQRKSPSSMCSKCQIFGSSKSFDDSKKYVFKGWLSKSFADLGPSRGLSKSRWAVRHLLALSKELWCFAPPSPFPFQVLLFVQKLHQLLTQFWAIKQFHFTKFNHQDLWHALRIQVFTKICCKKPIVGQHMDELLINILRGTYKRSKLTPPSWAILNKWSGQGII